MLKVRVIPTLLWKQFSLVKGEGFNSWRSVGSVLPAIKLYNQRDVDELILVDITSNKSGNEPDYDSVAEYARECFVPFTVGGGVNDIQHVQKLLRAGADKVCINTSAYQRPELINEIARRHGAQCVVASIDVKKNAGGGWNCYSYSGAHDTSQEVCMWAKELENRGAGEILITSIDKDGKMQGYDLELISAVTSLVNIPVIASGGAGNYEHMIQVIESGASAVAAASIFHFTEQTPAGAKKALSEAGVSVRVGY